MNAVISYVTSNALPLVVVVLGMGLLILEMYLPGFGLPGIAGVVLSVLGIVFMADSVLEGLIAALIELALLCIAFSFAIRAAAKGKLAKSKLVLHAVATDPKEENPLLFYVGKEGVVATRLSPVGTGEFDGVRLTVLSEGEFVEAGEKVKVTRVEGNRIYVRRV